MRDLRSPLRQVLQNRDVVARPNGYGTDDIAVAFERWDAHVGGDVIRYKRRRGAVGGRRSVSRLLESNVGRERGTSPVEG